MTAEAVPPRQKTLPWPLPLPPINTGLRQQAEKEGSAIIFKVWESLAKTELADQAVEESESTFTLFTLSDATWKSHLLDDRANPLDSDPVFQRLVLATQLVVGQVDLSVEGRLRTVGGRTLELTQAENGLQVNGVEVSQVLRSGHTQLCILEKLLFIRPEDIEIAVERAEGTAT